MMFYIHAVSVCAALCCTAPAGAAPPAGSSAAAAATGTEAVSLVDRPEITGKFIRLGDLFHGTADRADKIIKPAPEPGAWATFSIYELERLAKDFGLAFERPRYLSSLKVYRRGTPVSTEALAAHLRGALISKGFDDRITVSLYGSADGVMLPADFNTADIEIEQLNVGPRRQRFTAQLRLPPFEHGTTPMRITGRIREMRLMPVLARSVVPGERIGRGDIDWQPFPADRTNRRTVTSEKQLIGLTVRRTLSPGRLLNISDVEMPIAVKKGRPVTMVLQRGAMRLTFVARAVEDGAIGDMIRVENPQSRTLVDAVVISPDRVNALTPDQRYAAR